MIGSENTGGGNYCLEQQLRLDFLGQYVPISPMFPVIRENIETYRSFYYLVPFCKYLSLYFSYFSEDRLFSKQFESNLFLSPSFQPLPLKETEHKQLQVNVEMNY